MVLLGMQIQECLDPNVAHQHAKEGQMQQKYWVWHLVGVQRLTKKHRSPRALSR